ncbi:MAG: xanthine dehydrogenase family protein molybdopterin-binding subunit [Acidobacteria bacterium]|nr:xanthine dehydrogenase family protein molybdopterin-binding subunit [Acidobacteriota bacterium]
MSTRTFGQRITRNEDPQLLTGRALFVDDVELKDMVHVAFVRSPFAHARLGAIDTESALAREGVIAVYTAEDLGDYWQPGPLLVAPPPIEGIRFNQRTQVPLAKDKVRHVGEPVVMVVAESRYIAEDAVAEIFVSYEPLDAVVDLEAALEEGAPLVHDDLDSNEAAWVAQEKGDYETARAQADLVLSRRFTYNHGLAAAMENRGVVADWDGREQRLTMWDTTQAPIPIRNGLAECVVQLDSIAEPHEEHDPHVSPPVLADRQALEHLVDLLHLSIDFSGTDPDSTGIQDGVGAAVDDHSLVGSQLGEIAVGPHPRVFLEVGCVIPPTVGVVPESDRHGRKGSGADEFSLDAAHGPAAVVEHLDPHAEAPGLDLSGPDRSDGISDDEARDDVGAAGDRRQADVPLDLRIDKVEALGCQGGSRRENRS